MKCKLLAKDGQEIKVEDIEYLYITDTQNMEEYRISESDDRGFEVRSVCRRILVEPKVPNSVIIFAQN